MDVELRRAETLGLLSLVITRSLAIRHYYDGRGRQIRIDSCNRDNGAIFYSAFVDDQIVYDRNARIPRRIEDRERSPKGEQVAGFRVDACRLTAKGLEAIRSAESTSERSDTKKRQHTRGIDARRAFELVKEEDKTLKQAGAQLAEEVSRDKPFSPTAVSKAVKRHERALADIGIGRKARSISLRNAHQLRDDDLPST